MPGFWRSKPPSGTPIDLNSPIAVGLVGAWPMNEGSGSTIQNAVNPRDVLAMKASGVWALTPQGIGVGAHATSAGAILLTPSERLKPQRAVTVLWIGSFSDTTFSASSNPRIVTMSHNHIGVPPYDSYGLHRNWYDVVKWSWNGNGSYQEIDGGSNSIPERDTGRLYAMAFAMDQVNARGFRDGVLIGTSTTNVGVMGYDPDALLLLGTADSGSTQVGCTSVAAFIWDRKLADAEIAEVGANPWQMFAPPVWRRYFAPAAGAPPVSGTGDLTIGAPIIDATGVVPELVAIGQRIGGIRVV